MLSTAATYPASDLNCQLVLKHAGRLRGGAIGHGAIAFTDEMNRERAACQHAFHGSNVFRFIRGQLPVREDRITKALQFTVEELPRLLPVIAALGKINRRLARRLRLTTSILAIAVARAPV